MNTRMSLIVWITEHNLRACYKVMEPESYNDAGILYRAFSVTICFFLIGI